MQYCRRFEPTGACRMLEGAFSQVPRSLRGGSLPSPPASCTYANPRGGSGAARRRTLVRELVFAYRPLWHGGYWGKIAPAGLRELRGRKTPTRGGLGTGEPPTRCASARCGEGGLRGRGMLGVGRPDSGKAGEGRLPANPTREYAGTRRGTGYPKGRGGKGSPVARTTGGHRGRQRKAEATRVPCTTPRKAQTPEGSPKARRLLEGFPFP